MNSFCIRSCVLSPTHLSFDLKSSAQVFVGMPESLETIVARENKEWKENTLPRIVEDARVWKMPDEFKKFFESAENAPKNWTMASRNPVTIFGAVLAGMFLARPSRCNRDRWHTCIYALRDDRDAQWRWFVEMVLHLGKKEKYSFKQAVARAQMKVWYYGSLHVFRNPYSGAGVAHRY